MTSSNLVGCKHRQIGRIGALQDHTGVKADLTVLIGQAGAVAHEPAGQGIIAKLVHRRHGVARCQRYDLIASTDQKDIGHDDERADFL